MGVGINFTVFWDGKYFFFFFFFWFDGDQHFVNMEVASSSEALVHSVPSLNIRLCSKNIFCLRILRDESEFGVSPGRQKETGQACALTFCPAINYKIT
jgi:hypothetical protein